MRTFLSGDEKRISKTVLKSKPADRVVSHEMLRRKMSEVISLREQVAQAELAVGAPDRSTITPTRTPE